MFKWPTHRQAIIQYTLIKSSEGLDVYVAPALFNDKKTTKESVKGTHYLWCEFDGSAPDQWPDPPAEGSSGVLWAPEPTLRVQSSDQTHQHCYWRLDEFVTDRNFIEDTNRAIAYGLGADTSGWDINQVLRPPHTTNYKHSIPVTIKSWKPRAYSRDDFKAFKAVKQVVRDSIQIEDIPDVSQVVAKYQFDDHNRDLFFKKSIEKGHRSTALMALGYFCAEVGMADEEAYAVLLNADERWGKYRGRHDQQKQLLEILNRARHKYPTGVNTEEGLLRELVNESTPVEEKKSGFGISFTDLTEKDIHIEWVFEQLIEKKGLAILSGAPGTGKTQMSIQLSVCACLNKPFLIWQPCREMRIVFLSLEMGEVQFKHFADQVAGGLTSGELEKLRKNLTIFPLGTSVNLLSEEGQRALELIIDEFKPDGVVVDSMAKVSAKALTDEEHIKALNNLYARVRVKHDLFMWFIHHNRKATSDNKKPNQLADLYGNQYIAAETSVVLHLWKERDRTIEVSTLKNRLSAEARPFKVRRNKYLFFELINKDVSLDHLITDEPEKQFEDVTTKDMFDGEFGRPDVDSTRQAEPESSDEND